MTQPDEQMPDPPLGGAQPHGGGTVDGATGSSATDDPSAGVEASEDDELRQTFDRE